MSGQREFNRAPGPSRGFFTNVLHVFAPYASRRNIARIVSTFMSAIIIVIRPFDKLSGDRAFLLFTIKELVFSVQETLAQQVEATILNLMGATTGIFLSTLARAIADIFPIDSFKRRTVCAVFLISIAFFAGLVKSRLPRLTLSARISCLISIWILTAFHNENYRRDAIAFIWMTLAAATVSLFCAMACLEWSSTQFPVEVARAFSNLHYCLSSTLESAFAKTPLPLPSDHAETQSKLMARSLTLDALYAQAAFELRMGRLSVQSMKVLIGTVEHLRRELSWGMSFPRASPMHDSTFEINTINAFHNPALDLGIAVLDAMEFVEKVILMTYRDRKVTKYALQAEKDAITQVKVQLLLTMDAARDELRQVCDELDAEQRTFKGKFVLPPKIFDLCLFMISLLQMAHEMRHGVDVAFDILCLYEASTPHMWLPHLSRAWLGAGPATIVLEERGTLEPQQDPKPSLASPGITGSLPAPLEMAYPPRTSRGQTSFVRPPRSSGTPATSSFTSSLWDGPRMLRFRLGLATLITKVQESPHLQHAIKCAAGVTLLSVAAFLPADNKGRQWFDSIHGQWMIVSFLWVLETNTGATFRVGYLRISGTVIGALYAITTYLVVKTKPIGLVGMVTLAEVPISRIIIHSSFPSLGVVAMVTLPPLIFNQYLHPELNFSIFLLAFLRALTIGAGIIAAVLLNTFLFPRHCRPLFLQSASRTLGILSQLYMSVSRDLFQNGHTPEDKHKTLKLELQTRKALTRLSVLITTMNDELSLLPKPLRRFKQVTQLLQRILDLLTGLRKIRENMPQKDNLASVFKERRDLVSSICLSLFACEQVFRGGQPMPQYLPSSRQAFNNLELRIEERIKQAREESSRSLGLMLVYSIAESEVLKNLVDTLEELLELCGQLFGTSAALLEAPAPQIVIMSPREDDVPMRAAPPPPSRRPTYQ